MSQDTRKDPRAKVLTMTVRYKSATLEEFIEHHFHDISRGGMFIKTPSPFPAGTLLKFEVRIAENQRVMQGVGRVAWKRGAAEANEARPPGMGVKFIKIDDASRKVIDQLVGSRADAGEAYESGSVTQPAAPHAKSISLGLDSLSPTAGTPRANNSPGGGPSAAVPAAPQFFPFGEAELPPLEERTVMRQAAELLKDALRETGSIDDVGGPPTAPRQRQSYSDGLRPASAPPRPNRSSAPPPAPAQESPRTAPIEPLPAPRVVQAPTRVVAEHVPGPVKTLSSKTSSSASGGGDKQSSGTTRNIPGPRTARGERVEPAHGGGRSTLLFVGLAAAALISLFWWYERADEGETVPAQQEAPAPAAAQEPELAKPASALEPLKAAEPAKTVPELRPVGPAGMPEPAEPPPPPPPAAAPQTPPVVVAPQAPASPPPAVAAAPRIAVNPKPTVPPAAPRTPDAPKVEKHKAIVSVEPKASAKPGPNPLPAANPAPVDKPKPPPDPGDNPY